MRLFASFLPYNNKKVESKNVNAVPFATVGKLFSVKKSAEKEVD